MLRDVQEKENRWKGRDTPGKLRADTSHVTRLMILIGNARFNQSIKKYLEQAGSGPPCCAL